MGRKAGSKILKRSMAPNFWSLAKKQKRFVTRPHSGPHNLKSSMPLTVLLRDILNLTKTYNESKYVINEGNIQVDGKIRRDTHFPVGLMDVIEIGKINQIYRLVPSNNLLSPLLISPEEKNMKLCYKINALAPKKIADWAYKNESVLIHFSTDYIFNGKNKI